MADDQVKYSELIYDDNNSFLSLLKALQDIKNKMAELNSEAAQLKNTLKDVSTATRQQQQTTADAAGAAENLRRKVREASDEESRLNDTLKQFTSLSQSEINEVQNLANALGFLNQNGTKNMEVWRNMTQGMNGFNMSYNQMKATVKLLEAALRSLGTEYEKNSSGAKSAEDAVKRLKDAMKAFDDTTKRSQQTVARISNQYKKLTAEEIASVNALKTALSGSTQEQIAAVKAIDIQNKSYNELYQTYNAIKDVIDGMTLAEVRNTDAGKALVDQSKAIRDALNQLQMDTGNYALNVGNYMSAMNGLNMQTQQILREIPSAQNMSQFFLAISNNVPMFADAMARYNKELPGIKAKLAAVTEEINRQEGLLQGIDEASDEFKARMAQINELKRQENQLQGASVSGWKAVLKSVKSWQTLLVVGLLALRKLPDAIKWIRAQWRMWFGEVELVKNEMNTISAVASVMSEAIRKTTDETVKLDVIVSRLGTITKGTKEWEDAISMVNDITKSNLDALTATPEAVKKVTEAYKEQALQIAINDIVSEKIAKSLAEKELMRAALLADDVEQAAALLDIDLNTKKGRKFSDQWQKYTIERKAKEYVPSIDYDITPVISVSDATAVNQPDLNNRPVKETMSNAERVLRNTVSEQFNNLISDEAEDKLKALIKPVKPVEQQSQKTYQRKDVDLFSDELLDKDAVINLESSYERKLEMLEKERKKELQKLKEKYEKESEDLEFNRKHNLVTEEEYQKTRKALDENYNELIKTNYEGNFEEMGVIQRKYWNKRNEITAEEAERQEKEAEKLAKEEEQTAKDEAKAKYKALADGWQQKRAQLVEQGAKRKELMQAEVDAEINRLNVMLKKERSLNGERMSDEEKAKIQEWINLLNQLKNAGDFSNIKPGQIFGKGGANVSGEAKNYSSITEMLFPDMSSGQTSALNSVFDQAKAALNSWMEARQQAADQAKELADDEVSSAESALEREIELRNQGYANDVALRERELADAKKRQKEAAAEQKKIAKEQILLDAAMQTSSMITASANIMKQFPNPAAWLPMLAVMWGAFAYAKVKAYQAADRNITFGEGGSMLLEGGSHQSGHDVGLGVGPDGSHLRAEGGEYFAVINKRNSRKYGNSIPSIVNALNTGVFEDKYIKTSDAAGMAPATAVVGAGVDLSTLEGGMSRLVKQGEEQWNTEGNYRVLRHRNLTRRERIR